MKPLFTNAGALNKSHYLPGPQFHHQQNYLSDKICFIKLLLRLQQAIMFKVFSCAWHETVCRQKNNDSSEQSRLLQSY